MGNTCCRARSAATVASSPPRAPDWTEAVPLFREGVRGHPTVTDRYVSEGILGSGVFGVVCLAATRSSREPERQRVACKSILWSNLKNPEAVEDLRRELSIMASLSLPPRQQQHPAMVRLHEVYEDDTAVHMVMDLCDGGSVADRIRVVRQREVWAVEERAAARVAWELVEAVRALHAAGVMHRDIKRDNLMFSGRGDEERLKVIDFGFAINFRPGETFRDKVGSFPYMAPEIFARRSYGPEADVWSAGVIVYQLLCGRHPFPARDNTYKAQRKATLRGAADMEGHPWPIISGGAKDLVRRMLEPEPTRRPPLSSCSSTHG